MRHSNNIFAEEHPLRQIFSQIGALDDSHLELAIAEAWRCTCDMFTNSLGQFHHTALSYYTSFLVSVHNDSLQLLQLFYRRRIGTWQIR